MLRIIAEEDAAKKWRAWWDDLPSAWEFSGSMTAAVAKLLLANDRGVSISNLVTDSRVSQAGHVEMIFVDMDEGEKP